MLIELKLSDAKNDSKLGVIVVNDAETWPELLDTFLAALIASTFVLSPSTLYDEAISHLTERRDAINHVNEVDAVNTGE